MTIKLSPNAERTTPLAGSERPEIGAFISYARPTAPLVADLRKRLVPRLGILNDFGVRLSWDHDLIPGDDFIEQLKGMMTRSPLGLMMLSPEFFHSRFIMKNEVTQYLTGDDRRLFPIGLVKIPNLDRVESAGIAERQIYLLRRVGEPHGRWYDECRGNRQKNEFVDGLVDHIVRWWDRGSTARTA